VEAIELDGDSIPGVGYFIEVVDEHKVEMTWWLAGNDIEMHRTKEGV